MTTTKLLAAYANGERDFMRANLSGISLSDASLSGAFFNHADLSDANFKGANLRGAIFIIANLSHANLSGADLRAADLSHADLSHADLSHANLSGADFSGADLSHANLSSAYLGNADLSHANLSGADLGNADLSSLKKLNMIEEVSLDELGKLVNATRSSKDRIKEGFKESMKKRDEDDILFLSDDELLKIELGEPLEINNPLDGLAAFFYDTGYYDYLRPEQKDLLSKFENYAKEYTDLKAVKINVQNEVKKTGGLNRICSLLNKWTSVVFYKGGFKIREVTDIDSLGEAWCQFYLTTFTAKAQDNQTSLLEWQTATRKNNEGFHIQRSAYRKAWETIGFVQGHGTTQKVQNYTYTDEAPLANLNYYRLKLVDVDGQFEYSEVVSVEYAATQLFPNPAQDKLTIENGQGRITIFNTLGQVIRQLENTEAVFNLDISDLEGGQYFLHIQTPDGKVITKKMGKM